MAIALILMIFPMLVIGYFFISQAIAQPSFGVVLGALTVLFVGSVAWIRFLTMEKHLEDVEIGHDDEHLGPVDTVLRTEPDEEVEYPAAA